MNYQQANFVKEKVSEKVPLDKLAEMFYNKFGDTEYCSGPSQSSFNGRKKTFVFSNIDGNDIKNAASLFLRQKF